jgi:hypothetical protein
MKIVIDMPGASREEMMSHLETIAELMQNGYDGGDDWQTEYADDAEREQAFVEMAAVA